MLAGFAGIMIALILSVEPGMGDSILILAFVVIVIGGIGSIRGAFISALVIGLVDTLGALLRGRYPAHVHDLQLGAARSGPALASMLIYVLMALGSVLPAGRAVPGQGALDDGRRRSPTAFP